MNAALRLQGASAVSTLPDDQNACTAHGSERAGHARGRVSGQKSADFYRPEAYGG